MASGSKAKSKAAEADEEEINFQPLAVAYAITPFGAGALQALDELREWVEEAER